jgi:hypothetical protein
MAARKKTPAEIVKMIICAAMGARQIDSKQLAKLAGVHANTVYNDLKDPDGIPMQRVWLYFTALSVPVDEGLQAFADSFARSLTVR